MTIYSATLPSEHYGHDFAQVEAEIHSPDSRLAVQLHMSSVVLPGQEADSGATLLLTPAEAHDLGAALLAAAEAALSVPAQQPGGKAHRILRRELARLVVEHNRRAGTSYHPDRLGLERLTLWDGSEIFRDGCAWFLRASAPKPIRINLEAPR